MNFEHDDSNTHNIDGKIPVSAVACLDSRGFLFGPTLAYVLDIPIIMIRKKGKLPPPTTTYSYSLEYGEATLEIKQSICPQTEHVLIIDDLLATGGTANADVCLIQSVSATVLEVCCIIELLSLKGRERFSDIPVYSIVKY